MGLFKRKNKMTIEEYASYNLYIISNGEEKFFENNKDFLKFDIYSEIAYYTFFAYISEMILLKKYSKPTVTKIVEKIIGKMIEIQYEDCTPKTEKTKILLQNLYGSCYNELKIKNFDFSEKENLNDMAKLFLEILGISTDIIYIMLVCIEFSSFIMFHTTDILNNDIKLIEK